jgi:peptidoglycan/LPS O-acetylase OafA/YrhL
MIRPVGGRKHALDGLRGVAIALVVCVHCFRVPVDGVVGVDLFFVLSGLLITTILLDARDSGGISLRRFYSRRVRRLMPALVVMLAVFTAVTLAVEGASSLRRVVFGDLAGLGFSTNFVVANSDPNQLPISGAVMHLWSLGQEEQFYLVWPLALIFLRGRWLVTVLVVGIVASIAEQIALLFAGAPTQRIEFGPDTRSTAILFGCLLALALRSRAWGFVAKAARVSLPLSAVIFFFVAFAPLGRGLYLGFLPLFCIATAAIVAWALEMSPAPLTFRPLVGLGRISYSLYLWHMPILLAIGWHASLAGRSAAAALSLVAATASFYLVEQPFLKTRGVHGHVSGAGASAIARLLVRVSSTTPQDAALSESFGRPGA